MYIDMINKYTSGLEFLWNDTDTNELTENREEATQHFDRRTASGRKPRSWSPKRTKKGDAAPAPQVSPAMAEESTADAAPAPAPGPAPAAQTPRDEAPRAAARPVDTSQPAAPAMAELETSSNMIEVLRLRLNMIEAFREKALSDRNAGTLTDAMWKEENTRWLQEREKIEQEIQALSKGRKDAA
jgi:hypothetical protein